MELPSNISNLVNLQHLDIEGINLKEMPPKMGKLTKLRTLQYYIVGKESGSSIKELGKLSHLRKKLSIRNLRDGASAQDALDANLKGKKKIEELRLIWDGNTDDTQQEREVLEKLEPSENVKQLAINGYGGTMFPGWLGNSSFLNMVALTLSGCKNCWVIAIACTTNGWHQPLTIGSHYFQWLGNLPCLTLQPCLTAEQVEQHHGCL
jgi:hypothetical protein